jgi:hypothetical protein
MLLVGVFIPVAGHPMQINIEYRRETLSTLYDQVTNIIGAEFKQRFGGNCVQFYQTNQQHGQTAKPNKYMYDLTRTIIYGSILFFGNYCNLIPLSMDEPSISAPTDIYLSDFEKLICRKKRTELSLCHMIFSASDFEQSDLCLHTGFGGTNRNRIFSLLFARLVEEEGQTLIPIEENIPVYCKILLRQIEPYTNRAGDLLVLPQSAFRRWKTQMLSKVAMAVIESDKTYEFFDNAEWGRVFSTLVLKLQKTEPAPRRELCSTHAKEYIDLFQKHIVPALGERGRFLPVQSFLDWKTDMLEFLAVVLKPADFRTGLTHKYQFFQTDSWNLVFSACLNHQRRLLCAATNLGVLFREHIGPYFDQASESFVVPHQTYSKWKVMVSN